MKKFIYISLALLTFPILLNGCQLEESAPLTEPQEQSVEIGKCLDIQNTEPHEQLGYLDEQFNDVDKSGWHPAKDINEDESVFMGLSKWENEEIINIALENSTPSGDWVRFDEYCFNGDGNIARLYSDLRTFYGEVQVLRTWEYYSDESVKNDDIEIIDMNTNEQIMPNEASYMDNPPYMAISYDDLAEYLGL